MSKATPRKTWVATLILMFLLFPPLRRSIATDGNCSTREGAAQAPASQERSESKSAECVVRQTNDASIPESTFLFSGHVSLEEIYSCQFTPTLTFKLLPTAHGWQVAVYERGRVENLAGQHYITGSDIETWRREKTARELAFAFPLDHESMEPANDAPSESSANAQSRRSASGFLRITEVATRRQHNGGPTISAMAFEVVIHVMTIFPIDGVPVYRSSDNITRPKSIHTPDPTYSDEARNAKFQGTVVLWLIVGADGQVKKIAVIRSIGYGLDEKAVEAVTNWRFQPATKQGQPVPVEINVEVNFRL